MFLRYKASEKHRGSSYSGGRLCEEKGEKTDSLIEVKNVTKKKEEKKSLKKQSARSVIQEGDRLSSKWLGRP